MMSSWLRGKADLSQTLFPVSASVFWYCRGKGFYSPQNLSPGSFSWLGQHMLFLALPCFMSRGRLWSTGAMQTRWQAGLPPIFWGPWHSVILWFTGHISTPRFPSPHWTGGPLEMVDAKEKRILCCGFRVRHFSFYVWNDLLAFYFAEMKDFFTDFFFLPLNKFQIHKVPLSNAVFLPPPQCQLCLQVVFNPLCLGGNLQ